MLEGAPDNRSDKHSLPANDRTWRFLSYVAFVVVISLCVIANVVAGFANTVLLIILVVAGAIPFVGRTVSRITIGNILDIRGEIATIREDVGELRASIATLAANAQSNVAISLQPATPTASAACVRALAESIQLAVSHLPPEQRSAIEELTTDISRRSVRGEDSVALGIRELSERVTTLPEDIRKQKGIDDMLQALHVQLPTTTTDAACLRALVQSIQLAVSRLAPEERRAIDELIGEIRRRAAREEESVASEIRNLSERVATLPEDIRTLRGIDDMVEALRALTERRLPCYELARDSGVLGFWDEPSEDVYTFEDGQEV